MQDPRAEGGESHGSKDAELIRSLNLRPFFRTIGFGQKSGSADEKEVPAYSQENQSQREVLHLDTRERSQDRSGKQKRTRQQDPWESQAIDQVTCEKRREVHAQHMLFDVDRIHAFD